MKNKFFYIPFFCCLFVGLSSFGQNRKQLERKRKKLKREIKQVNSLLIETKKSKSNALDDLEDLSKKIIVRQRLIETIELETKELETIIISNEKKFKTNKKQLKLLKKDYSDMVVKTHKSKSQQSKTMFLLSSKNFYQAYKRIKYMQQYNDFRKKQGMEIIAKIKVIKELNDSLSKQKKFKESLITDKKNQKNAIEKDRGTKEVLVSKIKKKENKYKRDLENKIKEEKRVTIRIDRLIRNVIASANKNKKGTKESSKFVLDAAEKKLLVNFEQNKGDLPWPVKGIISRKYGVQSHPTFSGIKINSPGLHIVTKANTNAKSIFNGKVLTIQSSNDGKKSVYIQHGDYISTYNNLEKIYVKRGDLLKTGDSVGKVFTNKVSGKTKLIFLLYKNTTRLNPSSWIRKK